MTNRILYDFGSMLESLPHIPTIVAVFLTLIVLWAGLISLLMYFGRK